MTAKKRFAVGWAEVAVRDLERIVDYLEGELAGAGLAAFERIRTVAEGLTTWPLRGRVVPELALLAIATYREKVVAPYRVVYRVAGQKVLVVAVIDSRRDLESALFARLVDVAERR